MPSMLHAYAAKMGKRSRSKAGPSKSTSLLLAEPACSERTNTGAPVPEKDADEEVLEKLIFGDVEGFEAGLNELDGGYSDDSDGGGGGAAAGITLAGDGDADAGADLQALQDDELFFVDEEPSSTDVIPTRDIPGAGCDSSEGEQDGEEEFLPAWQNSDNKMLTISLANWSLLRNLQDTRTEDLISGKEDSARLHRQFERIYPVLEWAAGGLDRKRVRLDGAGGAGSSSGEDVGWVEEEVGDREATHKAPGRLQPEKLAIVRLADGNRISGILSMISTLNFHPQHPLLLSSGPDSTLRLHHINDTTNPPPHPCNCATLPVPA
ncbi:hypothetical protein HOY80DRAFT_325030 [Tuber brumale]|nr:hypothetical protein HOY80DRAFT_325030 [Tuber brumale]